MSFARFILFASLILFIASVSVEIVSAPLRVPTNATSTPTHIVTFLPYIAHPSKNIDIPTQEEESRINKPAPVVIPPINHPVSEPPVEIIKPTPVAQQDPSPGQENLYAHALERTVSLLCARGSDQTTIATAFFVHESGILLTNGHVAEDLSDNSCTVRQGAPAKNIGIARLLYVPKSYTATSSYRGKAPNDISLWQYAPSGSSLLTIPVPYFTLSTNIPLPGNIVTTFSFPAELVSYVTLLRTQYPLFSNATVSAYDATTLALTSSPGAQKGSSGGVVMSTKDGSVLGIIFGVDNIGPIEDRTLYALTAARINTIIMQEFGASLYTYLNLIAIP